MARIVKQPSSEQSSDNEDIVKLFPKCRPRYSPNNSNSTTKSDINKNRINSEGSHFFTHSDKVNENLSNNSAYSTYTETAVIHKRKMSEIRKFSKSQHGETMNDGSMASSYDSNRDTSITNNTYEDRNDKAHRLIYNADLDIGYHINSRTAACLRESRIEIAGGREIFSKSKSKPSKKRHSDEVIYHPPPPPHLACDTPTEEVKRFSGEVLYDDKFVQYLCSLQGYGGKKQDCSKKNTDVWTSSGQGRKSSKSQGSGVTAASSTVTPKEEPRELPSGQLVYETAIRNAEVVYDDIGDLTEKCPINVYSETGSNENVKDCSPPCSIGTLPSFVGLQETHLIHSLPERPKSTSPLQLHLQNHHIDLNAMLQREKEAPISPQNRLNISQSEPQSPSVNEKIARVIGNLPIAEYDGSPRRYGPRPGYPHRVLKEDKQENSHQLGGAHRNEDLDQPSSPSGSCQSQTMADFGTVPILNAYYLNSFSMEDNGTCYLPTDDPNSLDCDHEDEGRTKLVLSKTEVQHHLPQPSLHEHEFDDLEYRLYRLNAGNSYIGKRLAQSSEIGFQDSPKSTGARYNGKTSNGDGEEDFCPKVAFLKPSPPASEVDDTECEDGEKTPSLMYLPNERGLMLLHERVHQHTLSVDMAGGASNHENDRESLSTFPGTEDLGETEIGEQVDNSRNFTLSPETTDCDSNEVESEVSFEGSLNSSGRLLNSMPILEDGLSSGHSSDGEDKGSRGPSARTEDMDEQEDKGDSCGAGHRGAGWDSGVSWNHREGKVGHGNPALAMMKQQIDEIEEEISKRSSHKSESQHNKIKVEEYLRKHAGNGIPQQYCHQLPEADLGYFESIDGSCPPGLEEDSSIGSSPEKHCGQPMHRESVSDVIREIKQAIQMSKNVHLMNPTAEPPQLEEGAGQPIWVPRLSQPSKTQGMGEDDNDGLLEHPPDDDCDTDQETDRLLGAQRAEEKSFGEEKNQCNVNGIKKKSASKEVLVHEPAVLIEGVLFRARYLGSTQLVCEGQPTKATRMMQAEEAVSRIKAPEGEAQPSTEVDLFISTEKIMVLNTDLKEIMMDHSLRTISYIADIGDLVVLMARRRILSSSDDVSDAKIKRTPKMICHVFESEEAQFIAQSIGQAFQVAYMEFLKANGIEDSSFVKEMDYQEVLNSQEIFGNELEMFSKKEKQKEVVVPKQKSEILGMVIVESGWGSMLPTVVIANMAQTGPAARCGQLNIGDQIIAINGVSLVGLPLSTCQNYIKNTKNQTVVKLTVVPCAPVVEVKIKRPDTKYQLGFSVQNGVICSLLRGGIAERGGVRVGHRIIEINGQSVVSVPHEKIVNLLATSVGEILMKTMPTSMFRLLTGQELPLFI